MHKYNLLQAALFERNLYESTLKHLTTLHVGYTGPEEHIPGLKLASQLAIDCLRRACEQAEKRAEIRQLNNERQKKASGDEVA